MLLSLALIFTVGLILGEIFGKIKLPRFLGMIITGIVLGPFVLGLISDDILNVSSELRTIALVVILLRAGLSLDISDLKKIGRPAILMSFIPATLEIIAVVIFAPMLFGISYIEAAILGSVLAAVSPAVVVPKMIKLMKEKWGHEKRIPHLVMASASVDDIYVIVLFTSFIAMYQSGEVNLGSIALVPVAILVGIIVGALLGFILSRFFKVFRVRDTIKVLIILAVSFFVLSFEEFINDFIPMSALLSVMVIGITFLNQSEERALRLRDKFDKVWVFAELVLFVLVGAAVDVSIALDAGLFALVLLAVELMFRITGVQLCLIGTKLNQKERIFTGISYIPKATVQAAIGAIPLAMGVEHGELILALAVLAIIVTAPLGAIGIDLTYKKFLKKG
ncbi:K(+)/H(+) antiporter NhaP2 [Candidatus Izimaplasma bacterium HR1]|jgi:NhaP-type Na+/H+ or K+/H+ antiporter|uniref:cation:proton antiporter n=1 Tax=Candidatus Izimoplasma sp. HR1 TaxID=1541959 RepID=UPI0004F8093C|nr:K(+)/H(+) antiporter NhaP2 [Candidatus Izimaplasma bacterium HR1]